MESVKVLVTRERVALAGDALLITAAAFGVVTGATALVLAPDLEPAAGMEWASVVSAVLSLATAVAGPIVAWLLHGRHLTWIAVLGGVLGGALAGVLVMAATVAAMLFGLMASLFTDSEFAGPLILLALLAAAFVALVGWLVLDAVRDLAPSRRAHPRIDVVRLVSAVVLVIFAVGVAVWTASHPGDESGEALIIAMVAGVFGLLAVAGADTLTMLMERRRTAPQPTPAA